MKCRVRWLSVALLIAAALPIEGQKARISEESRMIPTYPFSEPNRIPILTKDTRLYPYHSFEGYSHTSTPRPWKVVHLENDLIEVFVLPEVGGKVWGAIVKKSGNEFIYRNEVLKFRNIALRGPWTSGGIEFNFGVIGHTPATATPVDYVLRENADGSVSCIVGMMDLPSRTHWRVEIRLPADRATFETNVHWYNPTVLEQPYYNWMTAAAPARDDLLVTIPGNATLAHSGAEAAWPTNEAGRFLPRYPENAFGGNASNHIVGERVEFFGGYLKDADYGFGHWALSEDMPGHKLWLWALSRAGGIWEQLLTDTDGQYVEYQAGRLLVQYAPGADRNPIAQVGFEPGAADRWTDVWFPLEGTGGLTTASRDGAIFARWEGGELKVTVTAFGTIADTLTITQHGSVRHVAPLTLTPLVPLTFSVPATDSLDFRIQLPQLGIDYTSNPASRTLTREWATDSTAVTQIPEATRLTTSARQLALAARYPEARTLFEEALAIEPWNREAQLGMAELEYRRARYVEGLVHVRRVLQLNTYDADANFLAANLHRALGHTADALDSYGWAARSLQYRAVANVQVAEMHLAAGELTEARRFAYRALDVDRENLPAREVLAIAARRSGQDAEARRLREEMLTIDPLHHFARAETFLGAPDSAAALRFRATLRSEFPDQSLLELAIDHVRRGSTADALRLLALGKGPEVSAWRAWLTKDPRLVAGSADLALAFPYRRETLEVLEWVRTQNPHWSWGYLVALNMWGLDRPEEATRLLASLDGMEYAPALVARGLLLERVQQRDPENDLRRAVTLDPTDRIVRIALVQYLQRTARWADALVVSAAGRARFPADFNLSLLHAGSLVQLGRGADAAAILDKTNVLPSEHARGSHQLYQQAHTLAALDAIDRNRLNDAERHLRAALEWPEHLGQGRPYEVDERLQRFLLDVVASRRGGAAAARVRLDRSALPALSGSTSPTLDDRLIARALEFAP